MDFLVNDNFDNLMRVINHFYTNQQEKKKIVCEVERLKLYLKYGFDQIITRTHRSTSAPACLVHDMGHALGCTLVHVSMFVNYAFVFLVSEMLWDRTL